MKWFGHGGCWGDASAPVALVVGHAFPPERPRRRHRNRGWETPSITSEQACAKGAPLGTKAGCSGRGSYSIIAHLDCVAGSRGVLLELVPPEGVLGLYSRRASVVETSTMLFLQRKISRQSLKHKWAHTLVSRPSFGPQQAVVEVTQTPSPDMPLHLGVSDQW